VDDKLMELMSRIEGAVIGEGAFSPGPAVWVGTREVAHIDADGALDVRLTKSVIRVRRSELEADARVTLRSSGSDWMGIRLASDNDVSYAVEMVRTAVAANLPTAKPGSPPTGEALARRRRFH
jgi:hypothetical protein